MPIFCGIYLRYIFHLIDTYLLKYSIKCCIDFFFLLRTGTGKWIQIPDTTHTHSDYHCHEHDHNEISLTGSNLGLHNLSIGPGFYLRC